MADDAFDIAVAQFARRTGLATSGQVVEAMQVQAQHLEKGSPITLAEALVKVGVITPAQRENVERNARNQKSGVQQLLHFRLLKKLGEGGMGAVYLAEDAKNGRRVAVKVLPRPLASNAEFLKRFRREADAASKLKHPNIVGAYEAGEDLGYHFYVMEFCEGEPLDRLLKREGALPFRKATEITLHAARGLKYAHDQGFIHRDIKPANLFLTKDGAARLLDLGLTKRLEDKEGSFKTVSGAVLGTPHYISPEQAQGEKGVDGRTDIYSLGATYYHLLTGQTPFDGTTLYEILSKHVTAQLPNPQDLKEDIPDGVVHVLRRMMAKDPADRYARCAELLQDLQEVLAGQSPKTLILDPARSSVAIPKKAAPAKRPPTVRRTVPRPQAPRSKTMILAVAAAAVLVIGGGILLRAGGEPQPRRTPPTPAADPPVSKTAQAAPSTGAQKPPSPDSRAPEVNAADSKGPGSPPVTLRRWAVVGPFAAIDGRDLDVVHPPDQEVDFSKKYPGKEGPVGWLQLQAENDFVDLGAELFPDFCAVAYAVTYLDSESAQDAVLGIGSDDGCRLWVNGVVHHTFRENRTFKPNQDQVRIRLNKGRNEIRLKVAQGSQSWHFAVTLQTAAGSGVPIVAEFLPDGLARPAPFVSIPGPVTDGWVRRISPLPPKKKLAHILAKLTELNPGYPGRAEKASFEGNLIRELRLSGQALRNIAPLRALTDLLQLSLSAPAENPGRIEDLSPLRGLPLQYLWIERHQVADLTPLRGMPLGELYISFNPVEDLGPLKGMTLKALGIAWSRVRLLGPLSGMSLESLYMRGAPVTDLSPLRGMSLTRIDLGRTSVRDLAPLRGNPLRVIELDPALAAESRDLLRSFTTLEKINSGPAAEFLNVSPPHAAIPKNPNTWVDLLNGRDLTGWRPQGTPKAVDGVVLLKSSGIDRPVASADFELEGALRILRPNPSNQGIGISLREPPVGGPVIKLYFFLDGDIHLNSGPAKVKSEPGRFRAGEWFRFTVRLKSTSLSLEIEGKEVLKAAVPATEPGLLHLHAANSEAEVRDLRLRAP